MSGKSHRSSKNDDNTDDNYDDDNNDDNNNDDDNSDPPLPLTSLAVHCFLSRDFGANQLAGADNCLIITRSSYDDVIII